MNRRDFNLMMVPSVLFPSAVLSANQVAKNENAAKIVYSGENCFIVRRGDMELIGIKIQSNVLQWSVSTTCQDAWSGWVSLSFHGPKARAQAEKAALTCHVSKKHGWPSLEP